MRWIHWALCSAELSCSSASPKPPAASASGVGAPRAKFANYRTFALAKLPSAKFTVTQRSLEVQGCLTLPVKSILEQRGYTRAGSAAELRIKLSTGGGILRVFQAHGERATASDQS